MRCRSSAGLVCLLALTHCSPSAPSSSDQSSAGASNAGQAGKGGSGSLAGSGGASGGSLAIDVGGRSAGNGGGAGRANDDAMGCGDGVLQAAALGEVCDDGNIESGDGCSADCKVVEQNFACLTPGKPCESTVKCGDGKISGAETCDDGNTEAGDGCSSDCALEQGWICPSPDEPCQAAKCGDGIVAGVEQCEDDDSTPGDGCSATCTLELGFVCETPGKACRKAVCGDGKVEGGEPCDDKNTVVGDGCSPSCEAEPICDRPSDADGCSSRCGDGLLLSGDQEECDDGNTRDGDGCSSTCKTEPGYSCVKKSGDLPASIAIPFVFRDFIALPSGTTTKQRHPDFQARCAGLAAGPWSWRYMLWLVDSDFCIGLPCCRAANDGSLSP